MIIENIQKSMRTNKNYILRGKVMEFDAEDLNGVRIKGGTAYIYVPKIINGSTISIGKDFATAFYAALNDDAEMLAKITELEQIISKKTGKDVALVAFSI